MSEVRERHWVRLPANCERPRARRAVVYGLIAARSVMAPVARRGRPRFRECIARGCSSTVLRAAGPSAPGTRVPGLRTRSRYPAMTDLQ
ncbi:hypothetical protein [Lysobacter gummosus]|uniref:hypothetical protein n=1 Tax=Lysobacter gummosus TaxID=262324 RepID=UPI003629F02D